MRGVEPRIFLFGILNNCLDVIVVEPVAVFLGCAPMWISSDICCVFSLRAHMELLVVALSVEVFWSDVIVLDGVLDV